MSDADFLGTVDLDITLRDVALDPLNSPTRRMIANAAIGVEPEDAYYSTGELLEAVQWVHEGQPGGKARLARLLANQCDDFQRCLYYAIEGRGVVQMMDDLEWLKTLLQARAQMCLRYARAGESFVPLRRPYVAEAPGGLVPAADPGFEEGPSWYLDPNLAASGPEDRP